MPYFSTRSHECVTASQAILKGLSNGGGLYCPTLLPHLDNNFIKKLCSMDYIERAVEILHLLLDDYEKHEIAEIVGQAYGGSKFDDSRIAPIKPLNAETYMLELHHGPTNAFKDMALQVLPHLLKHAAHKNGENRTIEILVATSGDTGKAALEGFKNIDKIGCTVFYPEDGVSDIQKLQMVTSEGCNVRVIGVYGNFDDTQTGVKAIFNDKELNERLNEKGYILSSANSINLGRLLPQVVYYISAYADLLSLEKIRLGDTLNFVVPTGNFGNILAAYYAKKMGLPINKLICASNANNILTDFFNTGEYDTKREFFKTISPSMDILISSNLERLLYEMSGNNASTINKWMNDLKENGSFNIGNNYKEWLNDIFYAGFASEEDTKHEIKRVFDQFGYILDPHTSVACHVLNKYRQNTQDYTPAVVVSTASPYKFPKDVLLALDDSIVLDEYSSFDCANILSNFSTTHIPRNIEQLINMPVLHTENCYKEDMPKMLEV